MTRRSRDQVLRDRDVLLAYVREQVDRHYEIRVPDWAHKSDVDTLVSGGHFDRIVKTEWDSQTGYAANLFGGAGVMKRRRAYLRAHDESKES